MDATLVDRLSWLQQTINLVTDQRSENRLREAYTLACHSPDPSTKNGAIVTDADNKLLISYYNKFPEGIPETPSRLNNRDIKYKLVVHSEDGCVFKAARNGVELRDGTMYCPFYCCSTCARAIIESGISRIVGHAEIMCLAGEHPSWRESVIFGWQMLFEAGVKCELYTGKLDVIARLNYQDIEV